eukprot:6237889-Prymnesium_polylepis.1
MLVRVRRPQRHRGKRRRCVCVTRLTWGRCRVSRHSRTSWTTRRHSNQRRDTGADALRGRHTATTTSQSSHRHVPRARGTA